MEFNLDEQVDVNPLNTEIDLYTTLHRAYSIVDIKNLRKQSVKENGIEGSIVYKLTTDGLRYKITDIEKTLKTVHNEFINEKVIDTNSNLDIDTIINNVEKFLKSTVDMLTFIHKNIYKFNEKLGKFIGRKYNASEFSINIGEYIIKSNIDSFKKELGNSKIYGYLDKEELVHIVTVYKEINDAIINIFKPDNICSYIEYILSNNNSSFEYIKNNYDVSDLLKDGKLCKYIVGEIQEYKNKGTNIYAAVNKELPEMLDINSIIKSPDNVHDKMTFKVRECVFFAFSVVCAMKKLLSDSLDKFKIIKDNIINQLFNIKEDYKDFEKQLSMAINTVLTYIKRLICIITKFVKVYVIFIDLIAVQFNKNICSSDITTIEDILKKKGD